MRGLLVAGNWKMNGDFALANEMIPKLKLSLAKTNNISCMLFPSFIHLDRMIELASDSGVTIGAQNVSTNLSGAYTGEVSLQMLKSVGAKQVLLGHSERRNLYQESDKLIYKKTSLAIENGFHVTFCVGETLEQFEAGHTQTVIASQLSEILARPELLKNITIAYEPVWAIGTGKTATPEQAQAACEFIRMQIAKIDQVQAEQMMILYGGSVNAGNANDLFSQTDIDGGLVGGASLKVEQFLGILECIK